MFQQQQLFIKLFLTSQAHAKWKTVDCAVGIKFRINTTANKNGEGEATVSGSAIVNSSTDLKGNCIDILLQHNLQVELLRSIIL